MQHKTSKRILKNPEFPMPLFYTCFFLKLPHEAEDIAIPLQSKINVDGMPECRASWTHAEGNATKPLDSINRSYLSFESEGLLSIPPLGDDDDGESESAIQLHQKNCLPLWKKLGSSHAPKSSNCNLERLSVDIEALPMRAASTIQGNNRIMPESEVSSEDVSCGQIMCASFSPSWRCFTNKEIIDATKNFHPGSLVGKGGFAKVYRGTLPCGQVIAIKKFNQSDLVEHREKEFLVEIGIMAHVWHPNTTPLIGFCLEGGLYLIYNFYPNGSLAGILHGTKPKTFDWPLRYKVAIGTARGLHYLHEQCRRRIIHRDIKASNILLDSDFEPQISDFGLAKWLPKEWSHHSVSPVEGTFGYLAPEYHMHGIVDEKIDVYSFGVLLLEILSGRPPVDDDQQCLVLWAKPLLEAGSILELADPELRGCFNHQQMRCMIITAEMCVRQSAISRPTMNQVLKLLSIHNSSKEA